MTINQDTTHIYERARTLALSGRKPGEVVAKLVAEGYPQAVSMLDSDLIRSDLRHLAEGSNAPDVTAHLWPRGRSKDERRSAPKETLSTGMIETFAA